MRKGKGKEWGWKRDINGDGKRIGMEKRKGERVKD